MLFTFFKTVDLGRARVDRSIVRRPWLSLVAPLVALGILGAAGLPVALAQSQQPVRLGILTIGPEKGPVGTQFTVSGDAGAPNSSVDIQWTTWDGSYSTTVSPETVAYHQRTFAEKRVSLGQVTSDADGRFSGTFAVPEDFGHLHDLTAVVNGQDRARGGFQVLMSGTVTPASGPIGTPIQLRINGLNPNLFSGSTLAVRYDNGFTGILTAATTAGTAEATIRATGPVGQHSITIGAGTVPAYLNIAQSPYDFLYEHLPEGEFFQYSFMTTEDGGPPADALEFPPSNAVRALSADDPRTAMQPLSTSTAQLTLEPSSGPILTRTRLSGSGLQPDMDVSAVYVTARGNRVSGSGWDVAFLPIAQARADAQGNVSLEVEIPDDLGGWHAIRLVQGEVTRAQAPFFVERSLVGVSTSQPRVGETFSIHAKGLGWTELDNGFAVTYDNMFVGYACGFNSNGDVLMPLVATGGPGRI